MFRHERVFEWVWVLYESLSSHFSRLLSGKVPEKNPAEKRLQENEIISDMNTSHVHTTLSNTHTVHTYVHT